MNNTEKFTVVIADKSDKKAIKAFYKSAKYSFSYMGRDTLFVIKDKHVNGESIIGAVALSQLTPENTQYLLHGLFIEKAYRNKGLASLLLSQASHFIQSACVNKGALSSPQNKAEIIAFAHESLTPFYLKHHYDINAAESLLPLLFVRYNAYLKKQPELKIFSFQT